MTPKELVNEFVRRCDLAMSGGSGEDPYELLHEDVDVYINGQLPLSGRYPGLSVVVSVLVPTAKARLDNANVAISELI